MNRLRHVILLVLLLLFVSRAYAQDTLPSLFKKLEIRLVEADLSVPESPAFTVLGVTPENIVRPQTPRALSLALLGSDVAGSDENGLALNFVPYLLAQGSKLTLEDYQKNFWLRLLTRTELSIGSVKDDDETERIAIGLHLTPLDGGDPRQDNKLLNEYATKLQVFLPEPVPASLPQPTPLPPGSSAEAQQQFDEQQRRHDERQRLIEEVRRSNREGHAATQKQNQELVGSLLEDLGKRNWNKARWVIAGAPSWIRRSNDEGRMRWNGAGFWTSYGWGFGDTNQLILHLRYRDNESMDDPDTPGNSLTKDSLLYGVRFRQGNANTTYSIEGLRVSEKISGRARDDFYRLALNLEHEILDGIWLAGSLGGDNQRRDANDAFFRFALRYGLSRKPQLQKELTGGQ